MRSSSRSSHKVVLWSPLTNLPRRAPEHRTDLAFFVMIHLSAEELGFSQVRISGTLQQRPDAQRKYWGIPKWASWCCSSCCSRECCSMFTYLQQTLHANFLKHCEVMHLCMDHWSGLVAKRLIEDKILEASFACCNMVWHDLAQQCSTRLQPLQLLLLRIFWVALLVPGWCRCTDAIVKMQNACVLCNDSAKSCATNSWSASTAGDRRDHYFSWVIEIIFIICFLDPIHTHIHLLNRVVLALS